MRYYILLLLFNYAFACSAKTNTRSLKLTFDKAIQLRTPADQRISSCTFGSKIYYHAARIGYPEAIDTVLGKVSIVVYSYDLATSITDSIYLQLPDSDTLRSWGASGIIVNDTYIAISVDKLYLFNKQNTKLIRSINRYSTDYFSFTEDGHIVMAKNYNTHPKDDSVKTKIARYDIETGSYQFIYPTFRHPLYTHLVNEFVTISSNTIALAQSTEYKIELFDKKTLKPVGAINSDLFKNEARMITLIDSLHVEGAKNHNIKMHFGTLKAQDSVLHRVEKIIFLTDDTLLVTRHLPNSKFDKRYIDVWAKNKETGNWNAILTNQLYQTHYDAATSYIITPETFPLNFTYTVPIIPTHNKQIAFITKTVNPPMGINNTEIKQYQDKYYEQNELNYFIWLYKWRVE